MKIEWTKLALSDVENIRDFIQRDSEFYASRFTEKIIESVENLKKFPNLGRKVLEADHNNIREIILNNYRIIYYVESKKVLILTVLHCARDLNKKETASWEIT